MKMLLTLALVLVATVAHSQVLDDNAVNLKFTGRLNLAKGNTVLSNSTVYLDAVNGNLVHISGSTTITSFGPASQAGIMRHVILDDAVSIAHDASTLALPGNATIVAAAGDSFLAVSDSLVKWIVLQYTRKATAP